MDDDNVRFVFIIFIRIPNALAVIFATFIEPLVAAWFNVGVDCGDGIDFDSLLLINVDDNEGYILF